MIFNPEGTEVHAMAKQMKLEQARILKLSPEELFAKR